MVAPDQTRDASYQRHVRALRLRSDRIHIRSGPRCACVCGHSAGWTNRRQALSYWVAKASRRSASLTWPEWMGSDAAMYPSGRIRAIPDQRGSAGSPVADTCRMRPPPDAVRSPPALPRLPSARQTEVTTMTHADDARRLGWRDRRTALAAVRRTRKSRPWGAARAIAQQRGELNWCFD
jgi:hypothetical protein